MKFADYILSEAAGKFRPANPEELKGVEPDSVDLKYIESKIDWDDFEESISFGTPQEQGRYNDTVYSGTIYYGKGKPWEVSFSIRGDAKVSKGWDSTKKIKGSIYPEYLELAGMGWRECKLVDFDAFKRMVVKHAHKDLKAAGLK